MKYSNFVFKKIWKSENPWLIMMRLKYMHRRNAIARQLFMLEIQIRAHMKANNSTKHMELQ